MSDIEVQTRKTVVETRSMTRTLPHLQLDIMPRKSTALDPYLTVTQRIVDGEPEQPVVRLRVQRLRRDGGVARNAATSFELQNWRGSYYLKENFTAETIERIEQARREVMSEFEAVDWEHA